jgi:hypothetical protein
MTAEPDPGKAIEILLEGTQGVYDRVAPLAGVFQSAEPEVAQMWRRSEELRRHGMALMTEKLLTKGQPRVDLSTATDIVFVFLGPETYQTFVADLGWSPDRWRRWTTETLLEALFVR